MLRIPKIFPQSLGDLYVVGGAVREALAGKRPAEYDLITTSDIKKLSFRTFAESNGRQTVGAFMGGVKYDISHYDSFKTDIERRDFTMNSIAAPVTADGTVEIEKVSDLCGGIEDMKRKLLRSCHPFENMASDPVRVVRGLRFVSEYSLDVESETLSAMRKHFKDIEKTARERIFPPLRAFIEGGMGEKAVGIARTLDVEKNLSVPHKNLETLSGLPPECRWPALFWKTDLLTKFAKRVFPPKRYVRSMSRTLEFLDQIESGGFSWALKAKDSELECLEAILRSHGLESEVLGKRAATDLEITPADLADMKVPGPDIPHILTRIWKETLTGRLSNEKEKLIEFVKKVRKERSPNPPF